MGGGLSIEMWRAENGSDVVDETLRDRIFGELAELATDFTNVQVVVEDSIATLSGSVATYLDKVAAAAGARRVRGVVRVQNDITVNPAQQVADEELATAVYAA